MSDDAICLLIGCSAIGIIAAVFLSKAIRFVKSGGATTQPARNATLLYYQIQRVYPKMRDKTARFLALRLNSAAAKKELTNESLLALVNHHEKDAWPPLCIAYTWLWHSKVSGIGVPNILRFMKVSGQMEEEIRKAKMLIDGGSNKFKAELRAIPAFNIAVISAWVNEGYKFNSPATSPVTSSVTSSDSLDSLEEWKNDVNDFGDDSSGTRFGV